MSGIKPANIRSDARIITVAATIAEFLKKSEKTTASEGDTYYDTTLNQLRTNDGSSWSPAGLNSMSAGSLDDAAQIGAKITNAVAIEIESTSPASNLLILDSNGTGTADVLDISQAGGATHLINLTQGGTGMDIDGTSSTWSLSKAGAAILNSLWLKDAKKIEFGTASGGDMTLAFTDGSTPGTAGAGLLLAAVGGADQLQIGSSNAIDVLIIGTSTANFLHWDASADVLITDNADIRVGDNDLFVCGDSSDVLIGWDGEFNIVPAANNADMVIGTSGAAMSLKVFGDTDTSYIEWKSDNDRLNFQSAASSSDPMLQFDDFVQVTFGTGANFGTTGVGDVQFEFDGTNFNMAALATDTPWKIGDTSTGFDITYNFETSGTIAIDYDGNVMAFDICDLRLGDDDYLLLGDSASAGSTTDGTLRWDNTNSVLEIIGNTTFEGSEIIVDNNLTVGGTLTMSGALAPGSIALGDGEELSFGDGPDYTISTAGSTGALILASTNANDAINIGDGSVLCDFRIDNATVAGADVWFDASADSNNGTWYFGGNDLGVDVVFYGGTSGDNITFDMSADRMEFEDISLTMMDSTTLLFGDGASGAGDFSMSSTGANLYIREIASAGKGVEVGVNGKGLDFKCFGETSSAFMEWTQASDALIFDLADINMGDGDKVTFGDGKDLDISASGTTITQTILAGSTMIIADADNSSTSLTFGITGTNGLDVIFQSGTASDDITFDAANKTLTFTDCSTVFGFDNNTVAYTTVVDSGDFLTLSATDNSAARLVLGTTGTNGMDIVFNTSITGVNSTFLAGANPSWTFGTSVGAGLDVVFQSVNVSTMVKFDAGAETWTFGATAGNGIDVVFDSVVTGASVTFDAGASSWTFGTSVATGIDVIFQGSATGATLTWDAGTGVMTSSSAAQTVYTLTALESGLSIPIKAGTPSSTSATSASLVYDSTNKKLYVFDAATTAWLGTIALT